MGELLVLVCMLAGASYWWQTRDIDQKAYQFSLELGRREGVQILDQSIQRIGIRLTRQSGSLKIVRLYHFYFSIDGEDRHTGKIMMLGNRIWASQMNGPITYHR